jgi:hypothetical protein
VVAVVSLDVQAGQGGLVALVQDEQLAVGLHRVHEPAQHGGPARRPCLRCQLLEDGPGQFVQAQVQRDQDVLFGGEVVVDRGLGEAERLGDLAQRGLVVALLGEQVQGDIEDPLAGVAFAGVPASVGQGPPGRGSGTSGHGRHLT